MKESWEINDSAEALISMAYKYQRANGRFIMDLFPLSRCLGLTQSRTIRLLEGLRRSGDIAYLSPTTRGGNYEITLLRKIYVDELFNVRLISKSVAS